MSFKGFAEKWQGDSGGRKCFFQWFPRGKKKYNNWDNGRALMREEFICGRKLLWDLWSG